MARTMTIAGVNALPFYKSNTAKIREVLRQTNVMNLSFATKGISDAPQEGAELIFKDGSRFLFAGYISRVQPTEYGKADFLTYEVEVSDYSFIFNTKIARRAYTNKTLAYIVTDLMNTYVDASYGFDLTNVATGPTLDTVLFDHISIKRCFEKLTKLTGYVWWVDYEKKLYFQAQSATPAPETVTDSSGNVSSVEITYDTSQVRNSVIVIGSANGVQSLDPVTEHFDGDGETRSWELDQKPSQMTEMLFNSVAKQFSLELNERDTDFFVYDFTAQSFRLTASQATPTASDDIDVTYYPRIPIIVQQQDAASIAIFQALDGGDGVYEYTIKEPSITSIEEAAARADQELSEYSMPLVDGKIVTRSGLLSGGSIFMPGQILTVNLPTHGLSTDTAFLIQEVRIDVLDDGTNTEYLYTIKFGGKIISVKEFLEALASKEETGEETSDAGEILTIESVTDQMEFSDSDVALSYTLVTPPYKYKTGSPQGVWGLSEWA